MPFTAKQTLQMANAARARAIGAIRAAHSGHVGIALGAVDILTAIYANHLRFDPAHPDWPDRDRFVLSAGHGSALLYATLQLAGYDIPDLAEFRRFRSPLAGHPEYGTVPGVETSTGPLGQGIANAVGMALAAKIKGHRAKNKEPTTIYCLCSDGDLMEGVAQEAIAFAGRYKLDNLIVFWDDNGISIDGEALTDPDVQLRMRSAGWIVMRVNGHRPAEINAAIDMAKKSRGKPVFIQAKTVIGLGASNAGTAAAHALTLDDSELAALEQKFASTPGEQLWKESAERRARGKDKDSNPSVQSLDSTNFSLAISNLSSLSVPRSPLSTRDAGGKVLELLVPNLPDLIGGSTDLAESTHVKTAVHRDITPDDFGGNFINYGVREHAMAAIMTGLALGGLRPYGGTFLVFSDYMRPAVRLAAMMGAPVIFVFSHDSIAVGEDGPTHQPIEHLTALRAIPNMLVLRPADPTEVAACWEIALTRTNGPTCIILTRQKIPAITGTSLNGVQRGGYMVKSKGQRAKNKDKAGVTLIATGSEVSLAIGVSEILSTRGVATQVVSMPSVEIFRLQTPEYRRTILTDVVIAIEAGATYSWYEFADAVVGIDSFGTGGDGATVYKHFGFDAAQIAGEILNRLK